MPTSIVITQVQDQNGVLLPIPTGENDPPDQFEDIDNPLGLTVHGPNFMVKGNIVPSFLQVFQLATADVYVRCVIHYPDRTIPPLYTASVPVPVSNNWTVGAIPSTSLPNDALRQYGLLTAQLLNRRGTIIDVYGPVRIRKP